jgi:predicted MFS family arabinose efflux permease
VQQHAKLLVIQQTIFHWLRSSVIEGLRYLLRHPELRVLAFANFANIAVHTTTWLSFIVAMRQQFQMDVSKTGLLVSIGAGAGVLGGLCTGPIGRRLGVYHVMLFVGILWTIGETTIALSVAPWMAPDLGHLA